MAKRYPCIMRREERWYQKELLYVLDGSVAKETKRRRSEGVKE